MTQEDLCPRTNPRIKAMMQDGTILCYMTHALLMHCSQTACCLDCQNKEKCPNVCGAIKDQRKREYIT